LRRSGKEIRIDMLRGEPKREIRRKELKQKSTDWI
jgi:hypothetical protein